jgi:hypothetical protein
MLNENVSIFTSVIIIREYFNMSEQEAYEKRKAKEEKQKAKEEAEQKEREEKEREELKKGEE